MLSIQNPSSTNVPVRPSSSFSWPRVKGRTSPVTCMTLLVGRRAGDGGLRATGTGSSALIDTVLTGLDAVSDGIRVTLATFINGSSATINNNEVNHKFTVINCYYYFFHTHTHTHTQPFYCSSGICPGLPG